MSEDERKPCLVTVGVAHYDGRATVVLSVGGMQSTMGAGYAEELIAELTWAAGAVENWNTRHGVVATTEFDPVKD